MKNLRNSITALILSYLLSACTALTSNTYSNNTHANSNHDTFLDADRHLQMGVQAAEEHIQLTGGHYRRQPEFEQYLQSVVRKLVDASDEVNGEYDITISNSRTWQAHAFPGRRLIISRETLARIDSELELAVTLAETLGGVAANHASGAMLMTVAITEEDIDAVIEVFTHDENVARREQGDQLAIEMLAGAGFDEDAYLLHLMRQRSDASNAYERHALQQLSSRIRKLPQSWIQADWRFPDDPAYMQRAQSFHSERSQYEKMASIGHELESRKPQDLIEELDGLAEKLPWEGWIPFLRGQVYLLAEDYAAADQQFTSAIGLEPNYYRFYLARSTARNLLGATETAREDYHSGWAIFPRLPQYHALESQQQSL